MPTRKRYNIYKQGKLCGDKIQYKDGVGCCIWYPINVPEEPEDLASGICFDFSAADLDDMIELLKTLKQAQADECPEDDEKDGEEPEVEIHG